MTSDGALMYDLHQPGTKFAVGKAIKLREGKDVALIATGETVIHALLAAGELAERGLHCRILSMHTVKIWTRKLCCKPGESVARLLPSKSTWSMAALGKRAHPC